MNIKITNYNGEWFVDVETTKGNWKNLAVYRTKEEALDHKVKWLMGLK